MDTTHRVRENRLRRMAERRGLRLERSRRRDPQATDYGTYRLINIESGGIECYAGSSGYGLTLDEIESQLLGASAFRRAGIGEHVDAEAGSLITVKPGAILDIAITGQHLVAEMDGSLRELSGEEMADELPR